MVGADNERIEGCNMGEVEVETVGNGADVRRGGEERA